MSGTTSGTTIVRAPVRRVAAWLEAERGPLVRRLARAVSVDPVRALSLPTGVAVVGVGGATLGGSGRTPLAIALVEALVARGHRVALVAHGYGARIADGGDARTVRPDDAVETVGDEAILAASALGPRAPVIVAPTREAALRHASERAAVIVVDRLLQTRPRRLAYALLATPVALRGAAFPFGDFASSPELLRAAADEVAAVPGPDVHERVGVSPPVPAGARVALITSLARPCRARDALLRAGLAPVVHVERPDHARVDAAERARLEAIVRANRIDAVVLDAKTRVNLAGSTLAVAACHALHHALEPSPALVDRVRRAVDRALAVRGERC